MFVCSTVQVKTLSHSTDTNAPTYGRSLSAKLGLSVFGDSILTFLSSITWPRQQCVLVSDYSALLINQIRKGSVVVLVIQ